MNKYYVNIFRLAVIIGLTMLTQIGGAIYVLCIMLMPVEGWWSQMRRFTLFVGLYLAATFIVVPYFAEAIGRERVKETETIKAQTFATKLFNRNYVKPAVNSALQGMAKDFEKQRKGIQIQYLDAGFPFFEEFFPLYPHKNHNDGNRIDLSLIYREGDRVSNNKPSFSGYGIFERAEGDEYNQPELCRTKGYWRYGFLRYFHFGKTKHPVEFSNAATKDLVYAAIKQNEIGTIYIEPHLKSRLRLPNKKMSAHGCRAKRFDDHIQIELVASLQ